MRTQPLLMFIIVSKMLWTSTLKRIYTLLQKGATRKADMKVKAFYTTEVPEGIKIITI